MEPHKLVKYGIIAPLEGDYLPLDNYSQPWQYSPTLRFKG